IRRARRTAQRMKEGLQQFRTDDGDSGPVTPGTGAIASTALPDSDDSDPDIVTGGPTINDKYRETAPISGIEERPSKAKAYAMNVQEKEAALQPMVAEAGLADEGMEE